jgi:SAM-dependent methyltransferase/uncharacterized protein YbaR (Trm112 family)
MQIALLGILVCPQCGGDLDLKPFKWTGNDCEDGLLVCTNCRHPYPVTDGVPRMLPTAFLGQTAFRASYESDLRQCSFELPNALKVRKFTRLHGLTARAFGYEWNAYRTTSREEDAFTFYWLTGIDPGIYRRASIEDVFTHYPTQAEVASLDASGLTGKTVLDVGCGMGKYLAIASQGAQDVIGLDLSDALTRARRELKVRPNVHLIQGNILAPPIRAGSIDLVYSLGVLHHTPDTRLAFQQCAALVKPGGALAVWLYPALKATDGWSGRAARFFQDRVIRPITCRLPPAALRVLAGGLGRLTFVRDREYERFRRSGRRIHLLISKCIGAVAVGRHKDPEIAAFLNFDWYGPQYRSYHSYAELEHWYKEAGYLAMTALPQPVSGIATRPATVSSCTRAPD